MFLKEGYKKEKKNRRRMWLDVIICVASMPLLGQVMQSAGVQISNMQKRRQIELIMWFIIHLIVECPAEQLSFLFG